MNKILLAVIIASTFALDGCVAVGLTALGVGMATGVSHTLPDALAAQVESAVAAHRHHEAAHHAGP